MPVTSGLSKACVNSIDWKPKTPTTTLGSSSTSWTIYELMELPKMHLSYILRFCQDKDKPIGDAWRLFQDLLRKIPHHGINKWLLVQLFYNNMIPEDKGKFSHFVNFKFASLHEDKGWDRIKEFIQYQKDSWDDPSSHEYASLASELTKRNMDDRLKKAHQQVSNLTTSTHRKSLKNAYLICDIYGGDHEADECDQNVSHEQVFLLGGDIYDDPSLLKFYQNNDFPPWGNYIKKEGDKDLYWVFTTLGRKTSPSDPALAIITRSGTTIRDPPYPASHTSPLPHKQANNDEIGSKEPPVNPAMIHMPKGAKVLKDLLSHKEKLEKAASSVKLCEECSAIIQKGLSLKEGEPGSFILPCLIGPLAVKNALADLEASINLKPYFLFCKLGIFELKPTKMSI
ncbi:hypothetical protein Tco_1319202 [Tanacetum coccineum]